MSTLKDKNGNTTYVGDEGVKMQSGKTLRQAVDDGDIGGGSDITIVNDLTTGGTASALSAEQGKVLNNNKQDKLKAGSNITIVGNIISANIGTIDDSDNVKYDLSVLVPDYLFTVANYCYHATNICSYNSKRNYSPVIYLDRLVELQSDGFPPNVTFLGGKDSFRICNTVAGNSATIANVSGKIVERSIKNKIVGSSYTDTIVNIPLYVSRNTNILDKEVELGRSLNIMPLGDSETDQGEWFSYMRKLVLLDNEDYKARTETDIDVMDLKLVGILTDKNNLSFEYRGNTITTPTNNCNEGRSSWACYTYLHHAKLYTWSTVTYGGKSKSIMWCAWRELGLYSKFGREYSGSDEDKLLVATTCNGQYSISSADIDGYVWNNNRNSIGYSSIEFESATSQQIAAMVTYLSDTLLKSPSNPFFSIDMVNSTKDSDECIAWSWDAYYSRYKNVDIDGTELANKGSKYIQGTYVCKPDYVIMNLGTNDGAGIVDEETKMTMVYHFAEIIHEQIGCPVIIFTPAFTSRLYLSGADDGYAEAQIKYTETPATRTRTQLMMSLCGTLSDQVSSGIYFCPTYWTQRFGVNSSMKYVDIGEDITEIGTIVPDSEVHPSNPAYDDWGYQIYSMLNYITGL